MINLRRGNVNKPFTGIVDEHTDLPPGPWLYQDCDSWPWEGMCGRLRAAISIAALAQMFRHHFGLLWSKPSEHCPGRFTDVFEPNTYAILQRPNLLPADMISHTFHGRASKWLPIQVRNSFIGRGKQRKVFEHAFRRQARMLTLKPMLNDTLQAFLETLPKNIIGVHVRRTDFFEQTVDSDCLLLRALRQVSDLHPDAPFLVCADNYESVQWLRKRFGERVFWRDVPISQPDMRKTTLEDAAIDLFALASTKLIVGCHKSSFFNFAVWRSGAKAIKLSS